MRVLFVVRPSVFARGGGDMTQALATKRGLEESGTVVDLVAELEPDARGYDIAHVFGVFDPEIAEVQIRACRRSGARIALSPIWWDLFELFGHTRACDRILAGPEAAIERRLARLRATPSERLLSRNERRKYARRLALQVALMRDADVLLPNSEIDARHYRYDLHLHDRPIVVVYNPVDIPPVLYPAAGRSGVVCVGRIEEKKNQALLLYALRGLDADVTLIGGSFEPPYMEICRRWIGPRVRVLGDIPHEAALAHLAKAAVHVLPSWAEIPGIASLEAAAAGARVVVSNNGTETEYFGELADYVEPEDPIGIRTAVERALALPPRQPGDALYRRLEAFSVAEVARRTLDGYALATALPRPL